MAEKEVHVVTGAFGFAGKYIARRLLEAGFEVRTVTNSQRRDSSNRYAGQKSFITPTGLGSTLRTFLFLWLLIIR